MEGHRVLAGSFEIKGMMDDIPLEEKSCMVVKFC